NPLCCDHFVVYLKLAGDKIADLSFEGSGCAISKSSASLMTQALKGKTTAEAEEMFQRFHELVTGKSHPAPGSNGSGDKLGKLSVFAGVSEFPLRVKCAILAWHALRAAMQGKQEPVSTE